MTDQPASTWEAPEEPGGPAPGLEYGGFGPRLIAYLIDVVIVGIVVTVIMLLAIAIGFASGDLVVGQAPGNGAVAPLIVGAVAVTVISISYFPWYWMHGGATPGMRMFGLRVVRDRDGGTISLGSAVARVIGMWVSSAVMYIGFIWVFVDKRRRGWHDLIGGTVVVRSR